MKTIHWPAEIEHDAKGAFCAVPFLLPECTGRGRTQEEAIRRATSRVTKRLSERRQGDELTVGILTKTVNVRALCA